MTRPATGIADWVRAHQSLRAQGPALEIIAEMLGLRMEPETMELHSTGTSDFEKPDHEPPHETSVQEDTELDLASPDALPASIRRLKPARQPESATGTVANDPLARVATPSPAARPRFQGLLNDRDAADMLCSAASVPMPTERIHAEHAVEALARAQPLMTLPRVHVPSLALGAQVLIDVGQSMQPFREDQDDLVSRLSLTLREDVEILYFADDPMSGAGATRRRVGWRRWMPPRPGTPVIVLSDLGCGHPRRQRATVALQGLARRLRRRQSRMVVFAPLSITSVPPSIEHVAEVVVWDRFTGRRSAARLRRAVDA